MTNRTGSGIGRLLEVFGIIGGLIVGRYSGLALLIPLGIAFGVYAVAGRRVTGARRLVMPAVAVGVGHLGWMIFGVLMTGQLGPVW